MGVLPPYSVGMFPEATFSITRIFPRTCQLVLDHKPRHLVRQTGEIITGFDVHVPCGTAVGHGETKKFRS